MCSPTRVIEQEEKWQRALIDIAQKVTMEQCIALKFEVDTLEAMRMAIESPLRTD